MLPSVDIGGLPIPTYLPAGLLSAAVGLLYAVMDLREDNAHLLRRLSAVLIITGLGAVLGSKILSFLSSPDLYDPWLRRIFLKNAWRGSGHSFFGAFMGGIACSIPMILVMKMPLMKSLDTLATASCLMLGVCKIGCLLSGCCWGKPTLFPIALEFHDFEARARPISVPLHATQIYEMAAAFLFFLVLMIIGKKLKVPGTRFSLALILYPGLRFFVEYLRGGELLVVKGLTFNQWTCLVMIFSGLVFFAAILSKRFYLKKNAAA